MTRPSQAIRRDRQGSPDNPAENDRTAVCPLCGIATENSTKVYTHLQVSHKKSELAGLVVDW